MRTRTRILILNMNIIGFATSMGVTVRRLKLGLKKIIFTRRVLVYSAENTTQKPIEISQRKELHAMEQPNVLAISPSIPRGKIEAIKIIIPQQTKCKKKG